MAENRQKMQIKKGDTVEVISGKDKAKKGKVLSVLPKEGKVIVEGVNILT
jgi:large subunit ribosomal protein L24